MSPYVLHRRHEHHVHPRPQLSHRSSSAPFMYNPSAPPFIPAQPPPGVSASPHIHQDHPPHTSHRRQLHLAHPPPPALPVPAMNPAHAYLLAQQMLQYPVPPAFRTINPHGQQTQRTQVPQKVWILDCKSCGMFLTNRGMKAVLLLHPSVSLYSTDAIPANCSPWEASSSSSSSPSSSSASSSTSTSPSSSSNSSTGGNSTPSTGRTARRTCECLTQTLRCHGCGAAVGYVIVAPVSVL
ncbi:hypothetical protein NEOLEDRAFT_1135486 [Neolentinus lepideus HHB14362 ss-1]|uniref:Uncharacterized protein n=1 Tax=Neolentinus lepideus HHB14362 ss-1 TaxID=1314782 RepID=A0A165RUA3_9AGAM|nr:hypothetical protein NEOLEDRAFT_1135486 [Neolentinus lepideus HHB14362 ss-1]